MPAPAAPTLKDVARAAQLSVSAVSYALRGAPNVPPATAHRVRAIATRLGYLPNARVAELMAQIRRGRKPSGTEQLALVWPEPVAADDGFSQEIRGGVRRRAAERGYRIEEFSLTDFSANPSRLADILHSRGLPGIVFGPLRRAVRADFAWPWDRFALAVIGTAPWTVPLPRAAHHHYEAMRLALTHLAARGVQRPVALLDANVNERAHRGWQAAWLAFGPSPAADRLQLILPRPPTPTALRAWLRATQPDGLLLSSEHLFAKCRAAGWRGDLRHVATLAWSPASQLAGIHQRYDTIASQAVDLVIAQLHHHERGLPTAPPTLLFPGEWAEPRSP